MGRTSRQESPLQINLFGKNKNIYQKPNFQITPETTPPTSPSDMKEPSKITAEDAELIAYAKMAAKDSQTRFNLDGHNDFLFF